MTWKIAGVVAAVLTVAVVATVLALMPRTSGDGWRLDRSAAWEDAEPQGGLDPTATIYGSDATSVGIGVTAFGSSSCPPELRNVEIGDRSVTASIGGPFGMGACTADAAPHQFGIVVQRDRLPEAPFDVIVIHDDRTSTTRIDELP